MKYPTCVYTTITFSHLFIIAYVHLFCFSLIYYSDKYLCSYSE